MPSRVPARPGNCSGCVARAIDAAATLQFVVALCEDAAAEAPSGLREEIQALGARFKAVTLEKS